MILKVQTPSPPKMERRRRHPPDPVEPNPNSGSIEPLKPNRIPISILIISLPVLYVVLTPSPPSTLFRDTTFWFLLSNTIIIAVAADSGVFSSDDAGALSDEPVEHGSPALDKDCSKETIYQVSEPPPPPLPLPLPSPAIDDKESPKKRRDNQSRALVKKESPKEGICDRSLVPVEEEGPQERRCDRTRSEIPVVRSSQIAGGEKQRLRRSATEKRDGGAAEVEYSRLSDEELNQRVEEFIRRFREIRLQEMAGDESVYV